MSATMPEAPAPAPPRRTRQSELDRSEVLALGQGVYYTTTGLWALVDIDSFQAVTGPKTDLWLVKTVGALVTVIGGVLGLAGYNRRVTPEIKALAMGAALGLAAIDVIYVGKRRIAKIYLGDALPELGLAAAWAATPTRGRVEGPRR